MTLESRNARVRYVGNGSATEFAFTFRVWNVDQVRVFTGDGSAEQDVSSTVSVTLSAAGGTVTFPVAPAAGTAIVIRRAMPFTQEDSYINGTRFNPAEIEDRLDQDCAERQELLDSLGRCIHLPETSDETPDSLLADILQARDDVQDAVETIGGAEYIMQAKAEVEEAMAEAGSPTGATRIAAAGTSTLRSLSERAGDFVNVKDFGAVGDGETPDTDAWEAWQTALASSGVGYIPAGDYLVSGTHKKFASGCIGNGEFDNGDGYWSQVHQTAREQSTIMQHRVEYDATSAVRGPIQKLQANVEYNNSDADAAFNFTRVIGGYYEGIGHGDYKWSSDNATGNFTVLAATAHNKFAGQFGMTAITGRVWDAKESEVSNITASGYGASKSCAGYFPFTRRSKYASGGYMIGIETYCMNSADETSDVPYSNSDTWGSGSFTSWTAGYHCTGYGSGAPITAGILIDGASGAKHAFYNGIVIGGSAMKINNVTAGAAGTIGLSFASWSSSSYGETAIKFGRATRHLYFKEGAKFRANWSLFAYESGDCVIEASAQTGSVPKLVLSVGATTDFSPDRTNNFVLSTTTAGSSVVYNASRGTSHIFQFSGANAYNLNSSALYCVSGQSLGTSSNRWGDIWTTASGFNGSDARIKQQVEWVPDAVLDAWEGVEWSLFKFNDAVEKKGASARLHAGLVAQDVQAVFDSRGLDATRYGFFGHDAWEEQWEERNIETAPAYVDEEGVEHAPVYETVREKVQDAGDAYSLRYVEALCIEAAYVRRELARIKAQIELG